MGTLVYFDNHLLHIQWDCGYKSIYSNDNKFELRIIDNSTIGIRHSNVVCDNCKKKSIQGLRWKCTKCFDFDLCFNCYMNDMHDLNHQFMRFDTLTSNGYNFLILETYLSIFFFVFICLNT